MSTNVANEKTDQLGSGEAHERYLLTVSHSGSFFGNEVRDYVLANDPATGGKDKDRLSINEDDEEIADKLTYFDYIKILWTKKVTKPFFLPFIIYNRYIFIQCSR